MYYEVRSDAVYRVRDGWKFRTLKELMIELNAKEEQRIGLLDQVQEDKDLIRHLENQVDDLAYQVKILENEHDPAWASRGNEGQVG